MSDIRDPAPGVVDQPIDQRPGATPFTDEQLGGIVADLKRDEGVRLIVYDDATGAPLRPGTYVRGHATIGIGRAVDATRGITMAEAEGLLRDDLPAFVAELDRNLPWWRHLDAVRAGVLLEMAFNMGTGHLLGFHNALAAMQSGNFDAAADGMLDSNWARQVGARAQRLSDKMRAGPDFRNPTNV